MIRGNVKRLLKDLRLVAKLIDKGEHDAAQTYLAGMGVRYSDAPTHIDFPPLRGIEGGRVEPTKKHTGSE